jgi:hypothetical protein
MALQILFWEGPYDLWRQISRSLRIPAREKFVVFPLQRDPEGAMLDWISANTGERDVVMSLHYLSPQILTYTGRPVNLNDFFEAPELRAKAREMLRGLYSSEGVFLSFCERNGSDYLVLSSAAGSDPTGDSPLFQAGFDHMPPGCAAYMMMFEPMKLRSFDLVYENEVYRVFRVGEPPVERRRPASPIFYSAALLWRADGDIREFYDTVMHIYAVTVRASRLMGAGKYADAEGLLAGALRIEYFYPAWNLLDMLYARERDARARLALAEFAWASDPWRASVNLALAESRLAAGDREGALELLGVLRSLPMTDREKARYRRLSEILRTREGGDGSKG